MQQHASNEARRSRHWLWRILPESNDRMLLCFGLLGAVAVVLVFALLPGLRGYVRSDDATQVTYVRQAWRVEKVSDPGVPLARGATIRAGEEVRVTVDLLDAATGRKIGEAPVKVGFNTPGPPAAESREVVIAFPDSAPLDPKDMIDPTLGDAVRGRTLLPGQRFKPLRLGEISMVAGPGGSTPPTGPPEEAFYQLKVVE